MKEQYYKVLLFPIIICRRYLYASYIDNIILNRLY